MKKTSIFLFLVLLNSAIAFGQLSGIYYIPTGGSTSAYASVLAAVNDLNTYGISGSVTFLVAPGYTESVSAPILLTATGSVTNTITFQKDGSGTNPTIFRTDGGTIPTGVADGQGDAVIIIQGSDYVTFDGIDVKTQNQGIEYGYYLRKVDGTNACKNVTIKNARVQMTKGTSVYVCGIFSSNNNDWETFYTVTVTSTGGRTENLSIIGNTVENTHSGIRIIGYLHNTAPYNLLDSNNTVGKAGAGNIIQNFGGVSTTTKHFGLYMSNQSSANINFNTIDNVAGGGVAARKELSGIYISGTNGGGYFVISNNIIKMSQQSSERIYWIYTAQKCDSIEIKNNTFKTGVFYSKGVASYMIYCSNATPILKVNGNQSESFTSIKEESGDLYGFYCAPNTGAVSGIASISDNVFTGIKMPAGNFWGIYHSGSLNQQAFIQNNTISDLINMGGTSTTYPRSIGIYQGKGAAGSEISGNIIENWSGGSHFIGINAGNPASSGISVFNNTVRNLIATRTNTGGNQLYVYGIQSELGNPCNIYKNKVYNLEANKINALVYGIIVGNSSTTDVHNIYNNFVSDLRTPNTDIYQPPPLVGIYVKYGTFVNVFYNTVFLNATSTGFGFGSAALYAAGIPGTTQDFRNNVLVNLSVPNGWGKTVAYQRNNDLLDMYSMNSNGNCLYAGPIEDNTHAVFYDEATVYNMDAFKTRVGPVRDSASFREMPSFIDISTKPYNLHMMTSVTTLCEGGAFPVTSPIVVSEDIDGDLRSATIPDVGADEFTTVLVYKTLNLKVFLEGLYSGAGVMSKAQDETGNQFAGDTADVVTVDLHDPANYSTIVYSSGLVKLSTAGNISVGTVPAGLSGPYYITIRHRNSIETTSASAVSFAGSTVSHDFTTGATQAYGDNQKDVGGGYYAIWGGDVNQDGIADSGDMNPVDNAATAITFGYVTEDVNGDGIVDSGDMNIVDNNATAIIMAQLP